MERQGRQGLTRILPALLRGLSMIASSACSAANSSRFSPANTHQTPQQRSPYRHQARARATSGVASPLRHGATCRGRGPWAAWGPRLVHNIWSEVGRVSVVPHEVLGVVVAVQDLVRLRPTPHAQPVAPASTGGGCCPPGLCNVAAGTSGFCRWLRSFCSARMPPRRVVQRLKTRAIHRCDARARAAVPQVHSIPRIPPAAGCSCSMRRQWQRLQRPMQIGRASDPVLRVTA